MKINKSLLLFHAGLLLILAGALTTYFAGESGEMHLRQGESSSQFSLKDGTPASLPFSLQLERFSVLCYPDSMQPQDYLSDVLLLPGGGIRRISMNRILRREGYRFYQAGFDPDYRGSVLMVSHDPWGIGMTYAGYAAVLLGFLGVLFRKNGRFRSLFRDLPGWSRPMKRTAAVAGLGLLVLFFFLLVRGWLFRPLQPVLRSPLLWVHVSCMMLAYTLLALVAAGGAVGLLSRSRELPLRQMGQLLLYPAVFVLMLGIIVGSVWANLSWGNYWSWDPKETWALITLLVYASALHGFKAFQRPRFFYGFAFLAFLCVLFTYFGVNELLGGMHAYS